MDVHSKLEVGDIKTVYSCNFIFNVCTSMCNFFSGEKWNIYWVDTYKKFGTVENCITWVIGNHIIYWFLSHNKNCRILWSEYFETYPTYSLVILPLSYIFFFVDIYVKKS